VRDTWPQIEKEYVATGKVRYVVRDLPLEAIHPHAFKAAEAAHCAGEQGKYWEMYRVLFANQTALTPDDLPRHARTVGLDAGAFKTCLDSGKHAARIRRDQAEAERAGVRGTPTFFFGELEGTTVKVLGAIRGAQPIDAFKATLDRALAAIK
jgi:protein-disulfide isomerase